MKVGRTHIHYLIHLVQAHTELAVFFHFVCYVLVPDCR